MSTHIEVHEKEWTGGRNKRQSLIRTQVFGGRIPVEIVNEINRLKPRSKTYHLERALKLYVLVLEYAEWSDPEVNKSAGLNEKRTRVLK